MQFIQQHLTLYAIVGGMMIVIITLLTIIIRAERADARDLMRGRFD